MSACPSMTCTLRRSARLQQVGGEAMTKHMGVSPWNIPTFRPYPARSFQNAWRVRQPPRAVIKGIGWPGLEQSAAAVCEIIFDGADGFLPNWHQTLLIALAGSPQNPKVQVEVANPNRHNSETLKPVA